MCDVNTGTDVPEEFAGPVVPRNPRAINPAISAIVAPEPVLHAKFSSSVEMADVGVQTTFEVVGMDTFRPTVSQLL
jgi:hypothetical protein